MKSAIRSFWRLAVLAPLCFALPAFAQNTVVLTSAGGFVWDDVYVSPYYGTVDGVPNTQVICDDFADHSEINGKPWNANITQLSSLSASTLGSTLWGSYYSGSQSTQTIVDWYEEAAWLTLGLLAQPAKSADKAYYSYATWAVFDASGVLSWLSSHNDTAACNFIFGAGNNCKTTNLTTGALLLTAQQNYQSGNYSNFLIITPLASNGKVCTPGNGSCPSQEFFEIVAEGGTAAMYLLLASLSCFGAMLFRSRRNIQNMKSPDASLWWSRLSENRR
jgi:hypothetical protein